MVDRLPYFPFFWTDWITSSKRALMSLAEQAAYFNLLCYYWGDGCEGLPTDEPSLLALSGVLADSTHPEVKIERIRECFVERDGKLHNLKLETLYSETVKRVDAVKDRAQKGAEARWKPCLSNAQALPDPMLKQGYTNTNTEEKKEGLITTRSEPPKTAGSDLVVEIVDLWNRTRKPAEKVRITPLRKSKIEARLKDKFTAEQLKDVVCRCRDSEWHQGKNDRNWKAPGPEWVLHSTERVEQWLAKKIDPKSEAAKHQGNVKPCGRCAGTGMVETKVMNRFTDKEDRAVGHCDVCGGKGRVPA